MKVLMFGWEFPPHISGGLGTACFGLTKDLTKLKVDITFVVPKFIGTPPLSSVNIINALDIYDDPKENVEKTQSKHLKKFIKINSTLRPYQNPKTYKTECNETVEEYSTIGHHANYGNNLLDEVVRYSMVGKKLAKLDFDIIHAHDWMTFLAAIEAKKESKKPLVVHVHSTEFDRSGEASNRDIYNIEKHGMDEADIVITVSKRMKKMLIEKYDISANKIKVVYNAVEKDDLQAIEKLKPLNPTEDKIVLFLGRITMQKGPEYFIEAANTVLKKMKNVRFVMAGSGDMAKRMIEKMASLDMIDRFHFTGFLKPLERERLFAMSSLYIMPSVSEPFGITPLEAIKHEVPVIISNQSGIAEVLDHAITIDFWDTKALSDKIIELLNSPDRSKIIAKENKKTLELISWANVAKDVLEIYNSLV